MDKQEPHHAVPVFPTTVYPCAIDYAENGAEALKLWQAGNYQLLLTDIRMPEMDGVEFTRHLSRMNYPGSLILFSGVGIRILKTVEKLAIEHELQVLGV